LEQPLGLLFPVASVEESPLYNKMS